MRNIAVFLSVILSFYVVKDIYFPRTVTIYKKHEQVLYYDNDDLPDEIKTLVAEEDFLDGIKVTAVPIIPVTINELERIPQPIPVPVIPVITIELDGIYPWEDSDLPLLDCDKIRDDDRIALACNIYFEARSEEEQGQWAVALVTRNRVKSTKFPNTYAEVVWQIRRSSTTNKKVAQFSWALDGKPDKVNDKTAWRKAWTIAGVILDENVKVADFTKKSLWYHASYVQPNWSKNFVKMAIIGNHIFYANN